MISRKELLESEYTGSTVNTTETTDFKSTVNTTETTVSGSRIVDRALEQTGDLINDEFKPWYAKQAYRLGADRYLGLASDARRGRTPAKLFSYLLRNT